MTGTLITILFGLAASLSWGSGDFCGGLASRRVNALMVVIITYSIGFAFLVALALLWREPFPSSRDTVLGVCAGVVGVVGLASFYFALSVGKMGIIAPVSAMLTAGIPVLFSIFTEGLPSLLQMGGFVLALLAILLISHPERTRGYPRGLGLALLAGCGFGGFYILLSRLSPTTTFWPLTWARLTSVFVLLLLARFRKQAMILPGRKTLPLIFGAGILDALGNAFFVLAVHSGRLDVASVLSSLYPAATVLLAAIVLRERVSRLQGIGILLALVAISLIAY